MSGAMPDAAADKSPRARLQRRVLFLKIVLLLFTVVLVLRLVQIQVVDAPRYQEAARRQYESRVDLPAARGIISDRTGKVLVSNAMVVSFGADPKVAGNERREIAQQFARVFRKTSGTYLSAMEDGEKRFVWLERGVQPLTAARIPSHELRGVIVLEEPNRLYHYDRTAGQLLGVTGRDHAGLSGLEYQYDTWLRGTDGYVVLQRDALRRIRPSVDYPRVEPVDGHNLVLTLDVEYQDVVEEELAQGIARTQADGGLVIMVDPATGEILALAISPSFNPNRTGELDQATLRNRIITDTFEPGSVFKVVTIAAALEKDAVRLDEKFNGERGRYAVPLPGGKTYPVNDSHPLGVVPFREAVEKSSNIVMVKVANRIGAEAMYTTGRAFGFGTPTGIELPGEVGGLLKKPREWSGTTLSALAYGYEVGVTPLQLVMAYAAVANHGILMKPYAVRRVVNAEQDVIAENRPLQIRRVVSEETARILTSLFEGVVDRGTATQAKVPGLRIAGKTGTAKVVVNGRYEPGSYTASFVGFFPADDPRVVCLVMLDKPRGGVYYGGLASAPIFKGIAEKIFTLAGRFKTHQAPAIARTGRRAVPDVVNLKTDVAVALLKGEGFDPQVAGGGTVIVEQIPSSGTMMARHAEVSIRTNDNTRMLPGGVALVPDLRGLSMRRAINSLTLQHLDASIVGSGTVVGQTPLPGERVRQGTVVTVRCEPRSSASISS